MVKRWIIRYEEGRWSGEAHPVEEEWNDQSQGNKKGIGNQKSLWQK